MYELNGQISMFGHDSLSFKTINMPKKQRFNNICINFKLKKLIKEINLFLPIIYIDS
tara:strand:+ start:103 stop:273 length:171 start_codon:yes stop_codon:yes gene_type:complete